MVVRSRSNQENKTDLWVYKRFTQQIEPGPS